MASTTDNNGTPPVPAPVAQGVINGVNPSPSKEAIEEKLYLSEEQNTNLKERNAKLKGLLQDISERKKYAAHIFWMVASWLIMVLIVLWLNGIKSFYMLNPFQKLYSIGPQYIEFSFHLSDQVLITLITTTTINIGAFFLIVTKYLFPNVSNYNGNNSETISS